MPYTAPAAKATGGTLSAAEFNDLAAGAQAAMWRVFTKRAVTGAYTLIAGDAVDVVLHDTATGAHAITIPTQATVAIPAEVAIPWRQYGAGQITFTAATGVTLVSRGSLFKSAGQNAEGLLTRIEADTWLLSGDIAA